MEHIPFEITNFLQHFLHTEKENSINLFVLVKRKREFALVLTKNSAYTKNIRTARIFDVELQKEIQNSRHVT